MRALDRPDLLAVPTLAAIEAWAAQDPTVADAVLVTEIDPDLADTAALTEAYAAAAGRVGQLRAGRGPPRGRRARGRGRRARHHARGRQRAVKRLLDVRKASFLPMDRAVEESGMEYGGITPLGLPARYRVLVDGRVAVDDPDAGPTVIIGSGVRRSKIALPGALLARAPGVELVDGLALSDPVRPGPPSLGCPS